MASDDDYDDYRDNELSDEELSGGSSDDDEHAENGMNGNGTHPAAKRQKVEAAPTDALHGSGDGIDHEQEAEASILQIEVKELISETAPPHHEAATLKDAVQRVAAMLKGLPEATVDPAPITGILKDFNFTPTKPFIFHPPTKVDAVGSFSIHALVRNSTPVDVAVEIPRACFDDKDYLNHRYHAKRALYLLHIASILENEKSELALVDVEWSVLDRDPRRPVLLVSIRNSKTVLRILPALPSAAFPLQRLTPDRNNLRSARATHEIQLENEGALLPTPSYNAGILQDMVLFQHANAMHAVAHSSPSYADAALLLRVWAARQRLADGVDGVNGFLLTMLLTHLIESGRASAGMGAMNLFRSTLIALAEPKLFAGTGLVMRRSLETQGTPPTSKTFRAAGAAGVFIDHSGFINLIAGVSRGALAQARGCASRTAALLAASAGPDAFDAVFLTQHHLASLYDVWYSVAVPLEAKEGDALSNSNDHGGPFAQDLTSWQVADRKVVDIAQKALGSRATIVRTFHRSPATQSSSVATKKLLKKGGAFSTPARHHVLLAARLDPSAALRGVDIGPPADSGAPAEEFRAFWGDKSELRRFQDGKICEAVVWQVGPSQRHLIVDMVLRHALQRHLGASGVVRVAGSSDILDGALLRRTSTPDDDILATRACEAAAGRLGKRLRTLDGLTLRVVGTQPLASVLRHTDVFPPLPHPLAGAPRSSSTLTTDSTSDTIPRCLPAVELLCQLEGSGKWPDGPAAFTKMKAALGVQLAQTLHSSFGISAFASEDYVDVFSDGFAFRLVLYTERDDAIQRMMLAAAGLQHPVAEDDVPLRVWHQGTISAVSTANPAYVPAVQLAKRWVASQWLSPHFSEECIELLVAAAFFGGAGVAAPAPASRLSGFLRFLHLLGEHPWAAQPISVDFSSGDPGQARRDAAARAHAAQRAAGTAPAVFLTGAKDDACVGWTRERPSKPVLHRAAVLARRSAVALEAILLGMDNESGIGNDKNDALAAVFSHNDSEYEVVIKLRPETLPCGAESLRLRSDKITSKIKITSKSKGKNKGDSSTALSGREVFEVQPSSEEARLCRAVLKGIPLTVLNARGASAVRKELLVGFDPVALYVAALEQRFGEIAVVCADYLGGSCVGIKLRGSVLAAGALRPEAAHALQPLSKESSSALEKGQLVVCADVAGVAADAAALGPGLVERVEYSQTAGQASISHNPLYR